MNEWTRTYMIPAAGPNREGIKVPIPDQADLHVEGWTSGTDGKVNVILFADDVPLAQCEARLEPGSTVEGPAGLVDCICAIPPSAVATAPVPDSNRRMTLFWDRAPEQTFCVTLRFVVHQN